MHGLINRSIQCFVSDTYGDEPWLAVASAIGIGADGFEPMLTYADDQTVALLEQVSRVLERPVDSLLEDVGTYMVSHPNREGIRRLLRFGGETFEDFLHSLADLPDWTRLAVGDLELPELEITDDDQGRFTLVVRGEHLRFAFGFIGALRALADDYGALVTLDHRAVSNCECAIDIILLDLSFAEGRSFSLVTPGCPAGERT